ncbi:MAG TPA: hypothetical protein VMF68_07520, partial [Spirochaetia bacterium]|nr:hypothetical protein [Spirochaetia bacterium]
MRQSLKIAVSLLAAVLLFAGFAVLAFSGLFNVLQASFFVPGIEKTYKGDLESLATGIEHFHVVNLETYGLISGKPFVAASFAPALGADTIKAWADAGTSAAHDIPFNVRLLASDGRRILYSSFLDKDGGDVKSWTDEKNHLGPAFRNYNDDKTDLPAEQVQVPASGPPRVIIDGAKGRFIYAFPVSSTAAGQAQQGTLLFYVSKVELRNQLTFSGLSVDQLDLIDTRGILVNGPQGLFMGDPRGGQAVGDALGSIWNQVGSGVLVAPFVLKGYASPAAATTPAGAAPAAGTSP